MDVMLQMDLWFSTDLPSPDLYDRITNLKKILFDIFADHTGSLSKLDYTSMVSELFVAWFWGQVKCVAADNVAVVTTKLLHTVTGEEEDSDAERGRQ